MPLEKKEFLKIRRKLEKTQRQLSQLLGISLKAVQSFEQGWRNIPVHVERQVLFLLKKRDGNTSNNKSCWTSNKCSPQRRVECPAWEFQAGHLCWFINGTICNGVDQQSWKEKMAFCRKCDVFKSHFPTL